MTPWLLLLISLVTTAHSPYEPRFPEIARAVDAISHRLPIYDTNDGTEKTAAELVSVISFESNFDPDAEGDHGASIGLAQIGVSNLPWLSAQTGRTWTKADLHDPVKNLEAAAMLMRASHRACRGWPTLQQLAAYATGNGHCAVPEGVVASKHRLERAQRLLVEHPAFWTEVAR